MPPPGGCKVNARFAKRPERCDVLNIGKLRKGGELYYLNSVARGVEDYYLGSGEAPGYWLASGTHDLGLSGEVGAQQLRHLLNGLDPDSARRLSAHDKPRPERVPGFDLTFRAPKSVSLLHALGPKEASNEVVSAHDVAVAAALGYLERHASDARRGKGGKNKIASLGFIGAGFRHRTSRAGDPLLHTHVLVANVIKGIDGQWGAVDARQLYKHAKTAGYLYQAQLRAELTRRLGVEWTPVRNGAADIAGIPRAAIKAFSRRRGEIEALLGQESITSGKAAELAAVTSRKAKDYRVSVNELREQWRERADRLGLSAELLRATLNRTTHRSPVPHERAAMATALAAPEGLTCHASTFTRLETLQGFCGSMQAGGDVEEIEALTDEFLASGHVVTALDEGGDRRYSTSEMLAVEQAVVEGALRRSSEACAVARPRAVEAALAERASLYDDQRELVTRITTSGAGVEVVVGKAGSGKTFALDAARAAWEASGYRVIGCALAARAAQELEAGSGIASCSIASLLADLDNPHYGGLSSKTVVVVDEAGMVGTRMLDRLLSYAGRGGAKVVLVGDDKQLPEIQAGGAFRGIKDRLGAVELGEVRRQPQEWEREALQLVRDGHAAQAIEAYRERDRVVVRRSSETTRRELIADWWASHNDGDPAVMIAARRSDVDDLNERARTVLKAAGQLGDVSLDVGGRSFAAGDRVMTLKNNRRLGVINGMRATVESVDRDSGGVTIRRHDGSLVNLPSHYLEAGHLGHAYAITGHKSQGMTTSKALVLGDETLYREWTYVAMSRGRDLNRLYVVAGTDVSREELGGEVAPVADPVGELVRAVGRSRAKDLALDSYRDKGIRNRKFLRHRDSDVSRGASRQRDQEAHVLERSLEL